MDCVTGMRFLKRGWEGYGSKNRGTGKSSVENPRHQAAEEKKSIIGFRSRKRGREERERD